MRYSRGMETESGQVVVFRSADHSAEEDAREVFTLLEEAGIPVVLCDDSAPGVPSGAYEVRVPAADAGRAESLMNAAEAQVTEPGDPSHALDLVTVFVSDAHNAEMEALAVRGVLEANGIPSVVVGATPYPNLPFEVRVPKAVRGEAERILNEYRCQGPVIESAEESDSPTGL